MLDWVITLAGITRIWKHHFVSNRAIMDKSVNMTQSENNSACKGGTKRTMEVRNYILLNLNYPK